jgi:hypothetical protein
MTVNLDAPPVMPRTDAPQSLHCACDVTGCENRDLSELSQAQVDR